MVNEKTRLHRGLEDNGYVHYGSLPKAKLSKKYFLVPQSDEEKLMPQTPEEWIAIEEGFQRNFPHCVGAIDRKHIVLESPIRKTNGVYPNDVIHLREYVITECPRLKFCGLMTIGKYGYDTSSGINPDFLTLIKCKAKVCQEFDLPSAEVRLSMGMSTDFEQAIELGSSNIRIGSSVFGFRERKK